MVQKVACDMIEEGCTGGGSTGSNYITLAVIGDSTSVQNLHTDESWPEVLQRVMNMSGANVRVHNLSYGGNTAYRSNTVIRYGALTTVEKAIDLAPDIVIVALGYNDALNYDITDNRSLADVQADMTTLFTDLRTGLPTAKLVYAEQRAYDSTKFSVSTLKNKGIIPYYFTLKSSGILAGAYCSEMLDDAVGSSVTARYTRWVSLDLHIRGITSLDSAITLNYWRLFRLGMGGRDGLHLFQFANFGLASYVLKGLRAQTWFSTVFPTYVLDPGGAGNDPDELFTGVLTSSGDGWTWTNATPSAGDNLAHQWGGYMAFYPGTWYMPSKGKFELEENFPGKTYNPSYWTVREGPANQLVYQSIDDAAFEHTGVGTDAEGYCIKVVVGRTPLLEVGAHTLRFKINNEVYGPYAVTQTQPSLATVVARRVANQALSADTLTTVVFDTEDIDTINNYSTSTGIVTISAPGMYLISSQLRFSDCTTGAIYTVNLAYNGAATTDRVCENTGLVPAPSFTAGFTRVMRLAAGATLQVQVRLATYGGTVVPGAASYSGASIFNVAMLGD